MSALTHLLPKHFLKDHTTLSRLTTKISSLSEALWATISFLLFLVLGPFSAIAVVFAVISLTSGQEEGREPESIKKVLIVSP